MQDDLSPWAGGGQAQAVRSRTAADGFLLLGDGADSAREVRVGVSSRSALDAATVRQGLTLAVAIIRWYDAVGGLFHDSSSEGHL